MKKKIFMFIALLSHTIAFSDWYPGNSSVLRIDETQQGGTSIVLGLSSGPANCYLRSNDEEKNKKILTLALVALGQDKNVLVEIGLGADPENLIQGTICTLNSLSIIK